MISVDELKLLLDLVPDDGNWQSAGIRVIIGRMKRGGYAMQSIDTGGPEVALVFTHTTIVGEIVNVRSETIEGAFRAAIEQTLAHHADRARGSAVQP